MPRADRPNAALQGPLCSSLADCLASLSSRVRPHVRYYVCVRGPAFRAWPAYLLRVALGDHWKPILLVTVAPGSSGYFRTTRQNGARRSAPRRVTL